MKQILKLLACVVTIPLFLFSCEKDNNKQKNNDPFLIAINLDEGAHYINLKGEVVLSGYEKAYAFNEGLACVQMDGKYGFINTKGEVVIPCTYSIMPSDVKDGMIRVRGGSGNYYGYINTRGEAVIDYQFYFAGEFENGYAVVCKREGDLNLYGMIDKAGNTIIPFNYKSIGKLSEGLRWLTTKEDKTICVNKSGDTVIELPNEYAYPGRFLGGVSEIWDAETAMKFGLIDKKGNIVLDVKYYGDGFSYDGDKLSLAWVINDSGKYGAIDKNGNTVIPHQYDYVDYFSDGLALVWKDDMYGFIDESGKEIIPLICSASGDVYVTDVFCYFVKGYVLVEIDGKFHMKNRKGETILTFDNWNYNIYW